MHRFFASKKVNGRLGYEEKASSVLSNYDISDSTPNTGRKFMDHTPASNGFLAHVSPEPATHRLP
jgi:hypothetical protein